MISEIVFATDEFVQLDVGPTVVAYMHVTQTTTDLRKVMRAHIAVAVPSVRNQFRCR
jgi:hypothetical protein